MKDFVMCSQCELEYHNPESRRFHTQPNCCSNCGPTLTLTDKHGNVIESSDSIQRVVELIKAGNIIAIKGLGGFHMCCDAKNELTVTELRRRKNRPDKPLAVMMKNIDAAYKYCEISEGEKAVLTSQKRPIVLLNKKILYNLPDNIAPCQKRLGVMLPYLPLHYLLLKDGIEVLVMTSGNMSGEPIQYENREAINHLKEITDYFLLHDRNIHNPLDDSVVKVTLNREMVSRRARGYIPYVQHICTKDEILALGAEQKNAFCVSRNGYVYLSQYLGDLKSMDSYDLYKKVISNFTYLIGASPHIYAHDLHPQYLSTGYAKDHQEFKIPVQHHHAHMVSCMFEHKLYKDVIGVVFDGTGLGTDGSIWGGEFLVGNRRSFKRVGCLKPVLLQGGDTAVKEPWKTAACYSFDLGYDAKHYLPDVNVADIEVVEQAIKSNFNCHWSSSMGRFFDCISAIIGVRLHISYDAQAPIELESILDATVDTSYDYYIQNYDTIFQFSYESIISGVLSDIEHNVSPSAISARFHNTISNAVVDAVIRIREEFSLNDVVLSGGVFKNTYLLERVYRKLKDKGFNVYFNEQIPINDSGISLGQLMVADEVIKEW
ncbi:MAG: carbamoyltransferase HypF [Clostridiales bacterium]|jgi:hydrogenase maturation protein HypF|nr:carbamoyltransferase HypF [Clostridiales bacterium]